MTVVTELRHKPPKERIRESPSAKCESQFVWCGMRLEEEEGRRELQVPPESNLWLRLERARVQLPV